MAKDPRGPAASAGNLCLERDDAPDLVMARVTREKEVLRQRRKVEALETMGIVEMPYCPKPNHWCVATEEERISVQGSAMPKSGAPERPSLSLERRQEDLALEVQVEKTISMNSGSLQSL